MKVRSENKNAITLCLEGVDTDRKQIRLDDFLAELHALRDALSCVDREANGKVTLYYRIIDLSHSSPATVTIQPVVKESLRRDAKYRNSPAVVHNRFFDSLHSIRFKNDRIENTSEQTIDAFKELISGLGTAYSSGAICNDGAKVPLDAEMSENVDNLIKPVFVSRGSVMGQLLSISFARGSKFYLYPKIGPASIACIFGAGIERQAMRCVKRNVRVFGEKQFRPNSGLPFRVNVTKIEELKTPRAFVKLEDNRAIYNGLPAHESIEKDRNEWG